MPKFQGYARDGNGNTIGGATVGVYLVGTSTLATIYSDDTLDNNLANPLVTTDDGEYEFFAKSGHYTVQISKTGYSTYSEDVKIVAPQILAIQENPNGLVDTNWSTKFAFSVPDNPSGVSWYMSSFAIGIETYVAVDDMDVQINRWSKTGDFKHAWETPIDWTVDTPTTNDNQGLVFTPEDFGADDSDKVAFNPGDYVTVRVKQDAGSDDFSSFTFSLLLEGSDFIPKFEIPI